MAGELEAVERERERREVNLLQRGLVLAAVGQSNVHGPVGVELEPAIGTEAETGLPADDPVRFGASRLVDAVLRTA